MGFGSIGQAVLPPLFRHIEMEPRQVTIITSTADKSGIAGKFGVELRVQELTAANYESMLEPCLAEGDFFLNLSVDVSSLALIGLCWQRGALYLDTCIEPWAGGYLDTSVSPSERSNCALREEVLAFRRDKRTGPTAIVTQSANPGLASIFVKQALLNIAADNDVLSLHELSDRNWRPQRNKRSLRDEITEGMDELGVLMTGNARGAYWCGSRLTIHEARELVLHNSATSLQVAAGVLGGMVWAIRNPRGGCAPRLGCVGRTIALAAAAHRRLRHRLRLHARLPEPCRQGEQIAHAARLGAARDAVLRLSAAMDRAVRDTQLDRQRPVSFGRV